jgi:hypothetical protein
MGTLQELDKIEEEAESKYQSSGGRVDHFARYIFRVLMVIARFLISYHEESSGNSQSKSNTSPTKSNRRG